MDREEIRNNIRQEATNVLVQVVLFVIYYILLIVLGVALFVGAGWVTLKIVGFFAEGDVASLGVVSVRGLLFLFVIFLAMWWFCIQIGIYLLKPLFAKVNNGGEDRCEISENEAPELFTMVREIAGATGNKMPKHVYLTTEVNACVSYNSVSVWSLLFPERKNLTIGVGLLQGLNQSELKAILSHEFGHFSQESMRVGVVTYRLLLISHDMVEYAKEQKEKNMLARASEDYRWYFHIATYPISAIASMTISFYNHIEKRNRSLSRYMEFEADAVACHIAGAKSHISALCKTEIMSNRFAIYEQMVFELLKEKNSVKHYLDGYSFVYEQLSRDEGLDITSCDTLYEPTGDEALFSSRISIIDGWSTHPSLHERIDHAKQLPKESEEMNTDSAVALLGLGILDKVGLKHQMHLATKLSHTIHWTQGLEHDAFTQWAVKALSEHRLPQFIYPFINKRIASFQISSDEDITGENVDYPFTQENRNLILEYNQAVRDWQILSMIKTGEYDAHRFLYNGKLYTDTYEPLALQKAYLDPLFDQWKELDIKIFKYLLRQAKDEALLKTTYWMKMYAGDALSELEPLYSYATDVKQGLDFFRSHGGDVSLKDETKSTIVNATRQFLNTIDYDAIISVCGGWKDNNGKTVIQAIDEWKEYADQSSATANRKGAFDVLEQVWQFLNYMFSVADNEWRKLMLSAYNDKSK